MTDWRERERGERERGGGRPTETDRDRGTTTDREEERETIPNFNTCCVILSVIMRIICVVDNLRGYIILAV